LNPVHINELNYVCGYQIGRLMAVVTLVEKLQCY